MNRKSLLELDQEMTDSAPAWAVSYGDMMSLLLTLFVMLVSMSEIKQNDKFQGVADSLHEQFRFARAAQSGLAGHAKPRSAPLAVLAVSGREARRRVMHSAAPAESHETPAGAAAYSIEFSPRSIEMNPAATKRLAELAGRLAGTPSRVEIRGRMESLDDLELAWQRARAVSQILIELADLEPEQLQISVLPANGAIDTSGHRRTARKAYGRGDFAGRAAGTTLPRDPQPLAPETLLEHRPGTAPTAPLLP